MLSLAYKSLIYRKMSERESPQAPNWGNLPFPAIKLIAELRFSNVFLRQILNLLGIFNPKSDISI